MAVHEAITRLFFDDSVTNDDITTKLVLGGFAFTAVQFVVTVVVPAPYGRYAQAAPAYLKGFEVNSRFAWMFQEVPSFLVPLALTLESWQDTNWAQRLTLAAFMTHYFQRSFVFPLLIKPSSTTTPFLPCISAFFFCAFNGFLQSHAVIYTASPLTPDEFSSPRFLAGAALFAFGMFVNIDSDRRLRALRKPDGKSESKGSNYKIPRGGAFEFVSAANYFGEIAEWTGFFVMGRNLGGFFFATFTLIFLGTRGYQHHKFYQEKFGSKYPSDRKAVIPYIL